MEKISGIVPSSPRLKSVDMKKERPVRASAPSFGQPVAESTNRGPVKHAVVEAVKTYKETYGADAKMAREAEIVKRMSDEFFRNQARSTDVSAQPAQKAEQAPEAQTAAEIDVPVDFIAIETPEASGESAPKSISVRA
ncbi:MAG TPA: hypothetical protein VFV50_02145 [Bdellovibrionales bacterium]|nr:hypothetical protein [Bdellovibrionales bacterium]